MAVAPEFYRDIVVATPGKPVRVRDSFLILDGFHNGGLLIAFEQSNKSWIIPGNLPASYQLWIFNQGAGLITMNATDGAVLIGEPLGIDPLRLALLLRLDGQSYVLKGARSVPLLP